MGSILFLTMDLDPVECPGDDLLLEAGLIAAGVCAIGAGIYCEMKHDLSGRLIALFKGDEGALPFDVKQISLKGEINGSPVKMAELAVSASALTKEQREKLEKMEIDPTHLKGRGIPTTASEARKVLEAVGCKTDKGFAERWSNLSGQKPEPLTVDTVKKAIKEVLTEEEPSAATAPA